jgi:hypothetical protein
MRKRIAVAAISVVMSAYYVALTACGGDDSSGTPVNASDAAVQDATTKPTDGGGGGLDAAPQDGSAQDSGGDAGATLNFALFNNLIPVEDSIQVCFAASTTGDPGTSGAISTALLPATPVAQGVVGRFTAPAPALAGSTVRVFVYYQSSLKSAGMATTTCADLISVSALAANGADSGVDASATAVFYQGLDFDSDVIPSGTFNSSAKYLLLPTGCPQKSNLSDYGNYCGPKQLLDGGPSTNPEFAGDFHVYAAPLSLATASNDAGPGAATVQGVDALQRYFYYAGLTFGDGVTNLGFEYGDGGPDAATDVELTGNAVSPFDGGPPVFPFIAASGALPPGTGVPAIATASGAFFDSANRFHLVPLNQLLTASGLQTSDLTASTSFTLIGYGDSSQKTMLADGGVNQQFGMVIIPNDRP